MLAFPSFLQSLCLSDSNVSHVRFLIKTAFSWARRRDCHQRRNDSRDPCPDGSLPPTVERLPRTDRLKLSPKTFKMAHPSQSHSGTAFSNTSKRFRLLGKPMLHPSLTPVDNRYKGTNVRFRTRSLLFLNSIALDTPFASCFHIYSSSCPTFNPFLFIAHPFDSLFLTNLRGHNEPLSNIAQSN